MIMFGLYQTRSYYGKPDIMLETYVLSVPSFLGYFVDFFRVDPEFARYAECQEMNRDEEDEAVRRFLRAGCSSSNPDALYLNLYSDGSCNVSESTLGVSDFQVKIKIASHGSLYSLLRSSTCCIAGLFPTATLLLSAPLLSSNALLPRFHFKNL